MSGKCLTLFTSWSVEQMFREGGSSGSNGWVLDASRARRCRYAICVKNLERDPDKPLPDEDSGRRATPHGAAFLVGEINDIVLLDGESKPQRWLVKFGRYALVDGDWIFGDRRNSVEYLEVDQLSIKSRTLSFRPLPGSREQPAISHELGWCSDVRPLTFAQAKAGLSAYLGVEEATIKIVVRV